MKQISRILVAVDFSEPARAGFEYALALATRHGAELAVVHAVPANQRFGWRARRRLTLAARLRREAEAADVRLALRVQQGNPAGVILLHALALEPDLIVLGTHQRTGLERLRAGSIAERVAVRATQPVLIVPARRRSEAVRPFDRVAVAVDFGAASARAVEWALALAPDPTDRVTLVHVVPGFSSDEPARHLSRYGVFEYQHQLSRDAWRQIQSAVPIDQQTPASVHARVVTGDPTTEIARAAADMQADLVVVGVPRRRAIARGLFGVTASRLMRTVDVPLLAVPEAAARATGRPDRDRLPLAA